MAKVVNLRTARKQKARAEKRDKLKPAPAREKDREEARHEGHRMDKDDG